jgi:hypothetical protein
MKPQKDLEKLFSAQIYFKRIINAKLYSAKENYVYQTSKMEFITDKTTQIQNFCAFAHAAEILIQCCR